MKALRKLVRVAAMATALVLGAGVLAPVPAASAWKQLSSAKSLYCNTVPASAKFFMTASPGVPGDVQAAAQAAIDAWNVWRAATRVTWEWSPTGVVPSGGIPVYLVPGSPDGSTLAESAPRCVPNVETGVVSQGTIWAMPHLDGFDAEGKTRVMVHEMGHLLGLGHPEYQWPCTTVMLADASWNYFACGPDFPAPYADDVAGVVARFAPNATPGFPADSALMTSTGLSLASPDAYKSLILNSASFSAADGSDDYRWTFVPSPLGRGWGFLVNTGSGLCLRDNPTGFLHTGAVVDNCRYITSHWTPHQLPDGTIQLMNADTKKCLGGGDGLFDGVFTLACSDGRTRLKAGPATGSSAGRPSRALPDTGHNVVGTGSGKCLSVAGGSRDPGSGVVLASCADTAEQSFDYETGSKQLRVYRPAPASLPGFGLVQDPSLCLTAHAQGIWEYPVSVGTCTQKADRYQQWTLDPNGNIRNVGTGLCVTVLHASTATGAQIVLYGCNPGGNETWGIPALLSVTRFSMSSLASPSGRGMTTTPVPGARDRAELASSGSGNTTWGYTAITGTGGGLLRDEKTGTCLRWAGANAVLDGACDGRDLSYRWAPTNQGNGSVIFQDQHTGLCLDLSGASDSAGTTIGSRTCSSNAVNQQWRIIPAAPRVEPAASAPSGPPNVALFGTATQSSTFIDGYTGPANASKAIDGNRSGNFFLGKSVTHTNANKNAWLQVDLGQSVNVGSIALYNRTDCCKERLTDYWVFVSSTPFNTALPPQDQAKVSRSFRSTGLTSADYSVFVFPNDTPYRYVMVQLDGTDFLSLAELEVTAGIG